MGPFCSRSFGVGEFNGDLNTEPNCQGIWSTRDSSRDSSELKIELKGTGTIAIPPVK